MVKKVKVSLRGEPSVTSVRYFYEELSNSVCQDITIAVEKSDLIDAEKVILRKAIMLGLSGLLISNTLVGLQPEEWKK